MDNDQNTPIQTKPQQNLNKTDKAIIKAAKELPNASNWQIGKKLQDDGIIKNKRYVYQRLTQSDYLRRELEAIRKFHIEFVQRELIPVALRIHKRVLSSRKLSDLKKKEWVFQAEKMAGLVQPDHQPVGPPTINIKQLQMLVAKDLT